MSKWNDCFLCACDNEAHLKCFAYDVKISDELQEKCNKCTYFMTAYEARNKILIYIGVNKHYTQRR